MTAWNNINANLSGANILDLSGTADIGGTLIRGQSGAIWKSTNNGVSWSSVTPGTDPTGGAASAVDYFWIEPSPTTAGTWLVAARKDQTADNWKSWLAITEDSGTTYSWVNITGTGVGSTIPNVSTSVVEVTREDNDVLLYGTAAAGTKPSTPRSVVVLSQTKAVVSWIEQEFPSNLNVQGRVLQISGLDVTTGASTDIDTNQVQGENARIAKVDGNGFLAAYNRLSDDSTGFTFEIRAATVSGTTISPGTATVIVNGDQSAGYNPEVFNYDLDYITDNTLLLSYWKTPAANSQQLISRKVDVTGTTITVRPEYDLATGSATNYNAVGNTRISDTRGVVTWSGQNEDYFSFKVMDIAGTSLISGSKCELSFISATSSAEKRIIPLSDDSFVLVWAKGSLGYAVVGQVSGGQGAGSITFGTTNNFTNDISLISATKISTSSFLVSNTFNSNPSSIQRVGVVSGTTISFGPSLSINATDPIYYSDVVHVSSGSILEINETDASGFGTKLRSIMTEVETIGANAKALGMAVSRGGGSAYVTFTDDSNLNIGSYDLPSLTNNGTTSLGAGTFGQSASKTRVAYPATRSRYYSAALDNGEVFVYGRMAGIPAVGGGDTGDPTHLARSTTSGTTYTLLANAFGADHVGAVEAGNNIFAMRNLAAGAGAFYAGATVPTLKSTVGFNVAPGGLYLSQDGYIVAGASGNSSTRFAFTVGPYNLWWNLTWNYPTSPAAQTVTGMIIV